MLVQDEPGAVPLVVGESPSTSPGGGGPRPIQTGEETGPGSPPPPEPALCAGDRAGHRGGHPGDSPV